MILRCLMSYELFASTVLAYSAQSCFVITPIIKSELVGDADQRF